MQVSRTKIDQTNVSYFWRDDNEESGENWTMVLKKERRKEKKEVWEKKYVEKNDTRGKHG